MYYKDKVINGVLHYKTSPNDDWVEMTREQLSDRIQTLNILIKNKLTT